MTLRKYSFRRCQLRINTQQEKRHTAKTLMTRLTLCRLLGIIFLLSGVAKAFNVNSFAYEVRLYADAYFWDGLAYWATPIAVLVCSAEIFFGLLALRQDYSRVCSVVFFVLLTFFTWLTAVNYFAPSLFGSIESCGCFGELIHFSPLASFIKSAVMWMMACIIFFTEATNKAIKNIPTTIINSSTTCSMIIAIILPVISLLTIEIVNKGLYTILYVICCTLSLCILNLKQSWRKSDAKL